MTKPEFINCMAVLIAGIGRPMPESQLNVWFTVLEDLTADQLQRAIVHALREHKFAGFPPVGLLRQIAGESGGVLDADAQAMLAWDKVIGAMRKFGGYHSVQWDDPAIPAAIETISESWPALCETPTEDLHNFTRARFFAAWKAHRANHTQCDAITTGILARDASLGGYDQPAPVAIGRDEVPAITGFGDQSGYRLEGPIRRSIEHEPSSVGDVVRRLVDRAVPQSAK